MIILRNFSAEGTEIEQLARGKSEVKSAVIVKWKQYRICMLMEMSGREGKKNIDASERGEQLLELFSECLKEPSAKFCSHSMHNECQQLWLWK